MKTLIFLFLFSLSLSAQNKFEIEIRGSRYTTYNQGELISSSRTYLGGFEADYFEESLFSNFRPVTYNSYSLGLEYRISQRNHLKFHIGSHQSGFIFDVDKISGYNQGEFFDAENNYKYLQLVPSYTYRLEKGRHSIPLDIGLSINIPTNAGKPYYLGSSHVNIDLRSSIGYALRVYDNITVCINFVSSYAPFPYILNSPVHNGTEIIEGNYQPYQFGLEAAMKYNLPSKGKTDKTIDELQQD